MKTTALVSLVLAFAFSADVANGQAGPYAKRGSLEAFHAVAEYQRRMAEDAEAWRTSKKLAVTEKVPESPRGQMACLSVDALNDGSVGYLEYWQFRVFDVVRPRDLILAMDNIDIPLIWLTGQSTEGIVDHDKVRVVGLVEVVGTKKYESETVRVIRLASQERLTQFEAEIEAKRKVTAAAQAKSKAAAKALEWRERWDRDKRTWKDKTGSFSVEAVYDSHLGDGKIRLLKEDGSEIIVHLSKLSDSDRRTAVAIKRPADIRELLTSRAWLRVERGNGKRARFTFTPDGKCFGRLAPNGTSEWTKWEVKDGQLLLYGRTPQSSGTFSYDTRDNRFHDARKTGEQFHFE